MKREGFSITEKYKMLLSNDTLLGLRFTGIQLATEYILSYYDAIF